MKKVLLAFLYFFFFYFNTQYAFNRVIHVSGNIYMHEGEVPIAFAIIELRDSQNNILQRAISDSLGNFRFHGISKEYSNYSLQISNEAIEFIINKKIRGKSNPHIWDVSIKERIEKIDDSRRVSHFIISIFTSLILFSIWFFYLKNLYSKTIDSERDFGVPILSLAFLAWGSISWIKHSWMGVSANESIALESVLSILNSILFMSSFPFFEHGVISIKNQKERAIWYLSLSLLFIVSVIISLFLIIKYEDSKIKYSVDLFISGITSLGLAISLYKTFKNRKLRFIGFVSILNITLMYFSQITMISVDFDYRMQYLDESIYVSSFAVFALILVTLAFSWINEKGQQMIINTSQVYSNAFTEGNDERQKAIQNQEIPLEKLKEELQEQIRVDKAEEVIEELIIFCQGSRQLGKLHSMIVIAARLTRIMTSKQRGIISENEYSVERNRINDDLLNIIATLKK